MAKNIKLILAIIGIFVILGIVGAFTFIKIPQEILDTTATGKFCHAQFGSARCETFNEFLYVSSLDKLGETRSSVKTWFPIFSSAFSTLSTNPSAFLCNNKMNNCKFEARVKVPTLTSNMVVYKIERANGQFEERVREVRSDSPKDSNDGLYHFFIPETLNTRDKIQIGYYDKKTTLFKSVFTFSDVDFSDPQATLDVAIQYQPLALDIIRADGFREPTTVGYGCNLQAINNAFSEVKVEGNDVIKQVNNVGISASDAGCTYSSCSPGQTLNWVQNFICSDSIIQSAVEYQGKNYICEVGVKAQLWEMGSVKIGTTDYKILDKKGPSVDCCPGVNYGDKICNKDFQLVPKEDITLACTSSKQCANGGENYVVNGESLREACISNICKVVERKAVECDGFTKFCSSGSFCSPLTNTCVSETEKDVIDELTEEKTFLEKWGILIIGSIIILILLFIAMDNRKGGKKRK